MNRSKRVVWGWLFGVVAAAFLGGMSLAWGAAPDAVQAEYERRAAQLESDDIAGHLELAIWCKEQGAYELLRKQCTLILAQEGEHEQAKLLLSLAVRHLGPSEESQDRSGRPGRGASGEAVGKLGRVISDAEIQQIRWMEMMQEEPRSLSIEFKNKVIQQFLDAMEGEEEFTGREKRRAFMRLRPTEKLQKIRKHTDDRFSDDILIKTDPKRMADFERRVLPVVLSGCATGRCHGDPQASRFALYTDRVMSKNKVYTNYLIMHDYRVGDKRLINRDIFKQSLLLTYGFHELPAALGNLNPLHKHLYKHPVDIKAIYRGVNDPKYRDIRDWLESFSSLEPDYGISLEPSGSSP